MDETLYNAELLRALAEAPGPAATRALLTVLEVAHGPLQAGAVRGLLARQDATLRPRIAALIPVMGPEARAALLAEPGSLEAIARIGLRDAPAVRGQVTELLAQRNHPECAYLLAEAAADPAGQVRQLAGQALLQMTRKHRNDPACMRKHIAPAVAQAARSAGAGRGPAISQAVVLLGTHCPPELLRWIDSAGSRLSDAVRVAMGELPAIESAGFVWLCLRSESFGDAARSIIAQADWPTLAGLGRCSHWLRLRSVRRALKQIRHQRAACDDPVGLGDLPAADQPRALHVAMACDLPRAQADALLSVALSGESPASRAAVAYVLARREPMELLLSALHSECHQTQAVAAASVIARGADANLTNHLLGTLERLGESVRPVIRQFLAADSFSRYWRSYRRLDETMRSRAGRALLKLDGKVSDLLGAKLVSREVAHQLQAVEMVRQMGAGGGFEHTLCDLARQGDRRVRASAVRTLAGCESFHSRRTLARCLDDPDPRVQANAIEALEAAGGDPEAVADKIHSPHNRARANAIRWLLDAGRTEAGTALATMLTDDRAAHRISAMWAAGQSRHEAAWPILERISLTDPDTRVRARAATLLRTLKQTPREVNA